MKILKCLAWVIGINKYMYYPDLHAAVNDATEFSDKLIGLFCCKKYRRWA